MKKFTTILFCALMLAVTVTKAQTVLQLNGTDCNGNTHDLLADLDAGKVVILHFFMPSCGSCPPPAQKIQKMANNVMKKYPGMVTAYAMPYNNSTTCSYAASWVSNNSLSLYTPYDSGATQVSHYGGFGMPTVVLLGGKNHRVMFKTLAFKTSDTTKMRDSMTALLSGTTGIAELPKVVANFNLFPNPAKDNISINFDLKEAANVMVEVTDITGKQVAIIINEKQNGVVKKEFSTANLPNGIYLMRLTANGNSATEKFSVIH